MKLGNMKVKRRYSLIWLLVDLFSVAALLYIGLIVYTCAADIEELNKLNRTDTSLSFLRWEPLLLWIVLGAAVWIVSLLLIFLPRKKPKRLYVNEKNAVKFCNTLDTAIACVRLILLHALSEGCYLHMSAILQRFSPDLVQLLCDAGIIALIIWFTWIRLRGISESARAEEEEKEKRQITMD